MKIYKNNDSKFKTIYLSYNMTTEVTTKDIFSYYAVLASLLTKSSKKYENQKEIEKYLNLLYGTAFDTNIEKIGDLLNIEFRMQFVNKKYLPNTEDLLNKVLDFLKEIIYNPMDWSDELIEREKNFIIEKINERKDEKLKYGIQKAEELICKGEPFGNFLYGDVETVQTINKNILIDTYKKLVNSCITISVSGNLDGYNDIETIIEQKFSRYVTNSKDLKELKYNIYNNESKNYETVQEYQDTAQSVISLGYRINSVKPQDFYAITIYNAILGTTPSSKLFQNVREKASLAYTVRSRYYRFKNIIIIFAGVNKENCQKAIELINKQIEDIKKGQISEVEFKSAKDSVISELSECIDSKINIVKNQISNIVYFKDSSITFEDMKNEMMKVTLEDVIRVANNINLEKVFILGGEKHE